MSAVGEREILTQQRVVEFFRDAPGYETYPAKIVRLTEEGVAIAKRGLSGCPGCHQSPAQ